MTIDDLTIPALAGVWYRTLLVRPGERDDTSAVFWLQFGEACGDIRAEAGHPTADTAFVGDLTQHGDMFRWTPEFEHGDMMGGTPDEGRLDLVADDMFEVGIHAPYLEHWHRVAHVDGEDRAIRFDTPESDTPGLLIEIGRFAFCARPSAAGGGAFILAERRDGDHIVLHAAGCAALPGDTIPWPQLDGDALDVPASALGPAMVAPARRIPLDPHAQEPAP